MSASASLVIPQHVANQLTKESCANCKFMHRDRDQDIVCRRMPPTAWLVGEPMPPPHIGKMGFRVRSASPPVEKDRWCGEWKLRGG